MSDTNGTVKPSRAEICLRREGVPYSQMTWERMAPHATHGEQRPANSVVDQRQASSIPINWEWIRAEIAGDRLDRYFADDVQSTPLPPGETC